MDTEPTYYVSAAFSGVGFLAPGSPLPEDATILRPEQVDPDVRSQGRAWLAAK